MTIHLGLGVTQRTAWHLAYGIRTFLEVSQALFSGPVEAVKMYIGGKR